MSGGLVRVRVCGAAALLAALSLALAACDGLPRDPRDTLRSVRGDTLTVGYVVDPPWVVAAEPEPVGVEPALVRAFAERLDAAVVWVPGTEAELMRRLERYELDLVVGGLVRSSPYGRHVALTLPFYGWRHDRGHDQHVMAVPAGENAWLTELERFLYAARTDAVRLVREGGS